MPKRRRPRAKLKMARNMSKFEKKKAGPFQSLAWSIRKLNRFAKEMVRFKEGQERQKAKKQARAKAHAKLLKSQQAKKRTRMAQV